MKKILIPALIILIAFLFSCKRELPDPGATSAVTVADEWWVKLYLNGAQVPIGTSTAFKHFYSYNTSENNDSVWVDDRGTLGSTYRFKAKVKADFSGLTFAANNVRNAGQTNKTVTITNGKIIKGVGHSKTGNKTDSIYLNIEYSDKPGLIYTVTGHARTFFLEDDY